MAELLVEEEYRLLLEKVSWLAAAVMEVCEEPPSSRLKASEHVTRHTSLYVMML